MKLSMLDVSINPYQGDRKQALKIAIEPCGFQHTWEGKHHSLRNLALYTPEIPIAATTENPKHMNSGLGFALPNLYRPDKIAVAFAALINSYGIHQVAGLTGELLRFPLRPIFIYFCGMERPRTHTTWIGLGFF